MPIYEYACKNCDHRLDALQKMSDAPLLECPECGEASLRRLLSAPRFRLKGEGWYETDFKKDNRRNLAKDDAEPQKSAKADSSDKADKADNAVKADKAGQGAGSEPAKSTKTAAPESKPDSSKTAAK